MSGSTTPDPVRRARSAVAHAVRNGRDATAARRRLHTEKARRAINEALTAPDAPTAEQRTELAALLLDGAR